MKRHFFERLISLSLLFAILLFQTSYISARDVTDYDFTLQSKSFIAPIDSVMSLDVIHIKTAEELAAIGGKQSEGKYYVLDNDINLVDEWIPIDKFQGTLDGRGYSINNLYTLANSQLEYAGLFGQINTTVEVIIKNIAINIGELGLNASPSSLSAYAGALVGYSYGSIHNSYTVKIINCYATGNVSAIATSTSHAYAGGLVGLSAITTITNSYATGDVSASAYYAYAGGLVSTAGDIIENSHATGNVTAISTCGAVSGGLVGSGSKITNSYATGNVYLTSTSTSLVSCYAGGLVGNGFLVYGSTITNSYATGNISAIAPYPIVGGLIGDGGIASTATITNSYATGNVDISDSYTAFNGYSATGGGLIGGFYEELIITDCYATGNVSISYTSSPLVSAKAGGLIGFVHLGRSPLIINSYRLNTQRIKGITIDNNGTPLTSAQMRTQSSFKDWDFNTTWAIDSNVNSGFPYLLMLATGTGESKNTEINIDKPSSWAETDIDRADKLGLLPDSLKGKYQENITRAEFCELAVRLYEKIKKETIKPTMGAWFTDTQNGNVIKMAWLKVVTGYADGTFKPNAEIARQEAATMLVRLMESLGYNFPPPQRTGTISSPEVWAYEYMAKIQEAGIMTGDGTSFKPLDKFTREEAIVTLMRIWDLVDGLPSSVIPELIENDYESIFSSNFSSDSSLYWNFAYWAALAAFDAYKDNPENKDRAMSRLGFDVELLEFNNEIKVVYGLKKLNKPIKNKNYIIMVSFRGTYGGFWSRNMYNNIFNSPKVTWYKQPGKYNDNQNIPTAGTIFDSDRMPLDLHLVHGGFFNYVDQVIDHNFRSVKWGNFRFSNTGKEILISDCLFIITGHSLGGALAELYSLYLYDIQKVEKDNIICYGVASPPSSSKTMQEYCRDNGMGNRIHKLYHVEDFTPANAGIDSNTLSQCPISFGESGGVLPDFTQYHFAGTYMPYIIQQIP